MISYEDELYHHGIKGQKWGVRRYQNADGSLTAAGEKRYAITSQKANVKQAKKDLKAVAKEYRKAAGFGFGIKRIQAAKNVESKVDAASHRVLDERAKLAGIKSKNSEKAEFRTYRRAMQDSGIRGSIADAQYGGRSTKMYDHIAATRGKEYADRVERSVQNHSIAGAATAGAIVVGAAAVEMYLLNKYG